MHLFERLRKLFDPNEKEIRRMSGVVDRINALEPKFQAMSDEELRGMTAQFRQRFAEGETLEDLLEEAFAVTREAARRTLGQRHYDVQLMGGIVLHQGRIAEMKTGEGKTLAATLPAYLNALTGRGVHIVTVNDYLAQRDADWMGEIYRFLGLDVGVIKHGLDYAERKQAYNCDITYGTNNEFGFDYLRDNMVLSKDDMVQRELNYAIVDEVDSILIDEARTPLIISGQAEDATDRYRIFADLAPRLKEEEDYTVDDKARTLSLTENGVARVEELLGIENLFDDVHFELNHYLLAALKALRLFRKDRDYVVKDGEIIIVDEFTGRLMFGRRYSDGLHQAIEAKERVAIQSESKTFASITFQNYFRMYDKLAGMTGTAATEEDEFLKIYGMDVVVIPTNKPMIRVDHPDLVYKTQRAKYAAIIEEIVQCHERKQPVLVGTVSIEVSEKLSGILGRRGVPHQVLNAKYHEKEAEIIKLAGQLGTVTIATNMAGRGTDIVLGDGVVALGGLHVIGTERHESRRIDNQLRGRSGRQGDPGSSRFYVSFEDDLMRLFGSDRITGIMDRLGWEEDQPIESSQVSRTIESAQKRVESYNFDIRKRVLEYDDVLNMHREIIYSQRALALTKDSVREDVIDMVDRSVDAVVARFANEDIYPEDWDITGLLNQFQDLVAGRSTLKVDDAALQSAEEIGKLLKEEAHRIYKLREEELTPERMRHIERIILLTTVDGKWMEHLENMRDLMDGIGLRAYAQQDPLLEYKFEANDMFNVMIEAIREDVTRYIFRVQPTSQPAPRQRRVRVLAQHGDEKESAPAQPRRVEKIGRNEPCPCGSGKKYKKCCGRNV
ncbi:MAG: preprotein translocase subunit SecA [Limnochordia bacterium]|jgi:preprotein translocase subunit SecA